MMIIWEVLWFLVERSRRDEPSECSFLEVDERMECVEHGRDIHREARAP